MSVAKTMKVLADETCRSRIILSRMVTAAKPIAEPSAANIHSMTAKYSH